MATNELTPYEILINDRPLSVVANMPQREAYLEGHPDVDPADIGLIALAVFRLKAYVDYAAVGRVDDVAEEISWSRSYESYDWIDWMAGFVWRDEDRAEQLHNTERKLHKFLVKYGWAPDVTLETEPNEHEMQGYINHVVSKDEINGQLVLPEEDYEEQENDGA